MSKDKQLANRLKENNYYENTQLKKLVAAVLVMENTIDQMILTSLMPPTDMPISEKKHVLHQESPNKLQPTKG